MPWRFDAQTIELVFVLDTNVPVISGSIEFGSELNSDLSIDTGSRENDSSVVDSGLRVIDGSI